MFLVTFPFSYISICLFLPIDAVQDVYTVTAVPRPTNYYSENAIFYRAICTPCAVFFFVVWLCAQLVNKMKNCTSKVEIIINGPLLFTISYTVFNNLITFLCKDIDKHV